MDWDESENNSNMTLLDGSNTGISFLAGTSPACRVACFSFPSVDSAFGGWVMFAVVARLIPRVVLCVEGMPPVVAIPDVGVAVVVAIVSVCIGFTKKK